MPTDKLQLGITVLFTPRAELIVQDAVGCKTESILRTRQEAADAAAAHIREQILSEIPLDCACSVVMGAQSLKT